MYGSAPFRLNPIPNPIPKSHTSTPIPNPIPTPNPIPNRNPISPNGNKVVTEIGQNGIRRNGRTPHVL